MRGNFCYLSILRAKMGEFEAIKRLSSDARSRLVPLFDVSLPSYDDPNILEEYLRKCLVRIRNSWGIGRPMYLDVHDLPLEQRVSDGALPIDFLMSSARMQGLLAIPVTGVEGDRDLDYLGAVRGIAARDGRGACLRLALEDAEEPHLLPREISNVLASLQIGPADLDVLFDLRYVGDRQLEALRAALLEALRTVQSVGTFRNVIVAGGSVPEKLGRADEGRMRRETRVERILWLQLLALLGDSLPLCFGDHGSVYAHFAPPKGFVSVPARIRYTTDTDHLFLRAPGSDYPDLCKQLSSREVSMVIRLARVIS